MDQDTTPNPQARRSLWRLLLPIGLFLSVPAVLAALLFPAVQAARNAARVSQIT